LRTTRHRESRAIRIRRYKWQLDCAPTLIPATDFYHGLAMVSWKMASTVISIRTANLCGRILERISTAHSDRLSPKSRHCRIGPLNAGNADVPVRNECEARIVSRVSVVSQPQAVATGSLCPRRLRILYRRKLPDSNAIMIRSLPLAVLTRSPCPVMHLMP
jgi:hypothetical protein